MEMLPIKIIGKVRTSTWLAIPKAGQIYGPNCCMQPTPACGDAIHTAFTAGGQGWEAMLARAARPD
ncbi:hypothetical protein GCM10011515_22840 [Tsuneonella deserti]|uniref:Uncharacterized protein n=1 Tax=Tsuneonella deserti TaxID=2035528 RepID=A0ABQ1SBT4_9SPHN|nr:hypothetical protein GCM10011515_22840 [Tsuneonella deserti]